MRRIVIISAGILLSLSLYSQGLTNNGAHVKVTNGTIMVVSDATNGDLTNSSGVFANYGDLYIEGDLDNDGIMINGSDATGDGMISISSTGSVTGSGTSVSERYYYGQSNDGSKPDGRWWYITPSVTGATSDSILDSGISRIWQYNQGWQQVTGTISLDTMKGFATRVGSNKTIQYAGDHFFHGTLTRWITSSGDPWHLVGNPYPAPIDFDPIATRLGTDIDPVIWIRTNGGFASYNSLSKITTNGGSNFLAPMQGFWVWCLTDTNFEVQDGDKDLGSTVNLLKSATVRNDPLIRLSIGSSASNGNSEKDEVVFAVIYGASDAFDRYDTRNKFGSSSGELFLELESGEQLAVSVIPELPEKDIYKLGVKIRESGTYTISADQFLHFPLASEVYLEDLYTGHSTLLSEGASYSFESDVVTSAERFMIRFQTNATVGSEEKMEIAAPRVYSFLNKVYIEAKGMEDSEIRVIVYDLMGKVAESRIFRGADHYSFPLQKDSGIYIVQLISAGNRYSEKIVLTLSR